MSTGSLATFKKYTKILTCMICGYPMEVALNSYHDMEFPKAALLFGEIKRNF